MGKKGRKDNKEKKENKKKNKGSKKKGIFPWIPTLIALVVFIGIGLFAYQGNGTAGELTMADMPALKGNETKAVLSPGKFRGKTATAYNLARQERDILDYLYCYCNCKQSIGHKSLLSCFTDEHAANCEICQDQAFYGKSLADKGFDLAQIRMAEDKKYWRPLR